MCQGVAPLPRKTATTEVGEADSDEPCAHSVRAGLGPEADASSRLARDALFAMT